MRDDIYYWKCDSPAGTEEKRRSYFKEKYDRADLPDAVRKACRLALGAAPAEVAPVRADGNHLAFVVTCDGQRYFLRADGAWLVPWAWAAGAIHEMKRNRGGTKGQRHRGTKEAGHAGLRSSVPLSLCPSVPRRA